MLSQKLEGVNTGLVAIGPDELQGIVADHLNRVVRLKLGFGHNLVGLEYPQRVGIFALIVAGGAGTNLAQGIKVEGAVMPILPGQTHLPTSDVNLDIGRCFLSRR